MSSARGYRYTYADRNRRTVGAQVNQYGNVINYDQRGNPTPMDAYGRHPIGVGATRPHQDSDNIPMTQPHDFSAFNDAFARPQRPVAVAQQQNAAAAPVTRAPVVQPNDATARVYGTAQPVTQATPPAAAIPQLHAGQSTIPESGKPGYYDSNGNFLGPAYTDKGDLIPMPKGATGIRGTPAAAPAPPQPFQKGEENPATTPVAPDSYARPAVTPTPAPAPTPTPSAPVAAPTPAPTPPDSYARTKPIELSPTVSVPSPTPAPFAAPPTTADQAQPSETPKPDDEEEKKRQQEEQDY